MNVAAIRDDNGVGCGNIRGAVISTGAVAGLRAMEDGYPPFTLLNLILILNLNLQY